ncbi:MAG: PE-PPE domain-containing protein [Mycobacterium sp.]|uniref:PE-PPE domain-containing protein n=1 Tax=Mycobacterium sp. TaxID=1785 RepID=UPI003C343E05
MNGSKSLAKVTAVGVFVGLASAMLNQAAPAYADGVLSGSETAIILGGTTEPMPSTEFAQTAEDLFLNPLGFDDGATGSTVCDMIGTDPCAAPLQVLTTPELVQQGPSSLTGADDLVLAVENEFNADPGAFNAEHPLTIFGYSQSATVESIAMTRLEEAGIPSDDLHFVFIGDPSLPVTGVWSNLETDMDQTLGTSFTNSLLSLLQLNSVLGNVTPDDLYPATIYSLDTDPVANFEEEFATKGLFGALLDIFGPHVEYLGLTPTEVADATTTIDGQLTLVDIPLPADNVDAWLSAVLFHGAADSGLLQSLFGSLELLFTNTF